MTQSELDEIQEDTTSMEEKLVELDKIHNDPKADILADMIGFEGTTEALEKLKIRPTCVQCNQPGHSFCNKD